MSDNTIRELRKARNTLEACQLHLARHAEMNAALHLSVSVMYSPLHAQVSSMILSIDAAIAKAEGSDDE